MNSNAKSYNCCKPPMLDSEEPVQRSEKLHWSLPLLTVSIFQMKNASFLLFHAPEIITAY